MNYNFDVVATVLFNSYHKEPIKSLMGFIGSNKRKEFVSDNDEKTEQSDNSNYNYEHKLLGYVQTEFGTVRVTSNL